MIPLKITITDTLDPILLGKTDPSGYSKYVDRSRDEFELKTVPLASRAVAESFLNVAREKNLRR